MTSVFVISQNVWFGLVLPEEGEEKIEIGRYWENIHVDEIKLIKRDLINFRHRIEIKQSSSISIIPCTEN